MPVQISGHINEGESAWIDVTATDANGDSVTPTSMAYWWTDSNGNAINSRTNVAVSGGDLAATTQIELTPEDTKLYVASNSIRVFTVRYIYNSARGNDKVRTAAGEVTVKSLRLVTAESASASPSESPSESPSVSPSP